MKKGKRYDQCREATYGLCGAIESTLDALQYLHTFNTHTITCDMRFGLPARIVFAKITCPVEFSLQEKMYVLLSLNRQRTYIKHNQYRVVADGGLIGIPVVNKYYNICISITSDSDLI